MIERKTLAYSLRCLLMLVLVVASGCMASRVARERLRALPEVAGDAEAAMKRITIARDTSLNATRNAVAVVEDAHQRLLAALETGNPDEITDARRLVAAASKGVDAASERTARIRVMWTEGARLVEDIQAGVRRAISLEAEEASEKVAREVMSRLKALGGLAADAEALAETLRERWLVVTSVDDGGVAAAGENE